MIHLQEPQLKVKQYLLERIKEINLPIPIPNSLPCIQFSGLFVGTAVIIENKDDAAILLNEGSFGKKAWPAFEFEKQSIIRKRQWIRRLEWQSKSLKYDKIELPVSENILSQKNSDDLQQGKLILSLNETHVSSCNDNIETLREPEKNSRTLDNIISLTEDALNEKEATNVIVINDSDDEYVDSKKFVSKLNPKVCTELKSTVPEPLYLTLEESFFLSFALYCLTVTHMCTSKVLNVDELWKIFISVDCNFIEKYVTYHYFRSKGWIVKSGLNYGCDFALYNRGPAFYHASCLVKIRNINHPSKPHLSWEDMMGYCRVAESAKKDFVLCEVTWPKNITPKTCDIKDLSNFCVSQKLLQRWTASEHREKHQTKK